MAGMLPKGMINVADIGIRPDNTGAQNSKAARDAQAPDRLPVNTSERWLFGGGEYRFDGTDPIAGSRPAGLDLIRPLWIEGIGGSWWHPRTVFRFPAGKDGIHIHGNSDDPSLDATPAGISNIGVIADGKTTVAHGVVVDTRCNFSHVLINQFRGNGLHIGASLEGPVGTRSDAILSRFDSVAVLHCGNSVAITSMTMTGTDRILKINTAAPHQLQVDDIIWLEPITPDPKYPRGVCTVTSIGPGATFECQHEKPLDPTTDPASGSYQVVVGNGIFTHGSDAHASSFTACYFVDNAGWAVLEDSQSGNAYLACSAENNVVGSYYTGQAGLGNVFMGCWDEGGRHPSEIDGGIVIGGDYGVDGDDLTGDGLHILKEKSTRLQFHNTTGGYVRLGSRDTGPTATRYLEFSNRIDSPTGEGNQLSIDFDQALPLYQKMLGFGQFNNQLSPAFLITGPSSFHVNRSMRIDAGTLVIHGAGEGRYWLGMTRHETVIQRPDDKSHPNDTWQSGDRAWNRFVNPFAPAGVGRGAFGTEGWICTGGTYVNSATPPATFPLEGGTLGEYKEPGSEPCTARTDGRKTVSLNKPSSVLKPGMYLVINDKPSFITSISLDHVTLTMNDDIPPGGPGLPIKYNPPDFHKFGSIALLPNLPPPPPGSPPPPPPVLLRANLPAAATAGAGASGCVSDANTTVFGAVVAGGGANFVPVYCDGTNWRIG